jgi:pimeloyl-ACP methyl ester carboxylesterase
LLPTFSIKHHKAGKQQIDLAFADEGKGKKTLLFIHGLGHSHSAWIYNILTLSEQFRCIAVDLPGNGSSAAADYPYSLQFFADCIHDFIVEKQLKQVYLVGHSMGGQIAMTLALKYPEVLSGLILCAPAGFEQFNDWEKNLYRSTMYFVDMVSNEENSLRKAVQNSFYLLPDNVQPFIQQLISNMHTQDRKLYRRMTEACISGMLDEPVYDRIPDIKHPVLVIFGEKDTMIPNRFIHPCSTRQLAEAATRRFPNAQLEMIPLCGHFVQWEKASRVNNIIRHFVQNH